MLRIANFGGGVNSAAGILMNQDYDEIIFSDTGSEWPETYQFIEDFVKKTGIKLTVVKSDLGNIYSYYWGQKAYPTPTFRDCTKKFKITPMRRYRRQKYGKKETFEINLFIDYGESHRMRLADVKYETNRYPLVEAKIDRQGCIDLIKSYGIEPPVKSGCFFCPFNNKAAWLRLRDTHPELFQQAKQLETNAGMKRPLIAWKGKNNQTLMECGCFNG